MSDKHHLCWQPAEAPSELKHVISPSSNRKLSDMKLLHSCDSMIIEWAELVSEFLQQHSSQPVLDGLKPLPSEEFYFWRNRLNNLHFIQQQVMMSHWQQPDRGLLCLWTVFDALRFRKPSLQIVALQSEGFVFQAGINRCFWRVTSHPRGFSHMVGVSLYSVGVSLHNVGVSL